MAVPQLLTTALGTTSAPFITPVIRGLEFEANRLIPNEIPPFDEALNATLSGWLSHERLNWNAKSHGINIGEWTENLHKYCFHNIQTNKLHLRDEFVRRECTVWETVIRNRLYVPSIEECGVLYRRQLISETLYNYLVDKQVDKSVELRDAHKELINEIPGPQDLIRFAVREAYNPELIELFGYNKEVPTQVLQWMSKQGYGGNPGVNIPNGGTDGDGNPRTGRATWLDLYWWAHWELPSLTQGYEMLHRLYPTSDFGRSPISNEQNQFQGNDLEKLQKAQDIPDYWRQRLQAISYHPIDKADGEFMFENSLITESQYYHIIRQHGQNDTDTKLLLEASKLRKKRNLGIDPGQQSLNYVCEYYKLGIISDQDAVTMLEKNGYNRDDTTAFLSKCKLEVKGESVKALIQSWEQAYYRGLYNQEQLTVEMARHNLNTEITRYWIAQWTYKRDLKYKTASAKQNLTAFTNGIITEAILTSRLFNLGYESSSITIMVNNAKYQILQRQTQALLKAAKQQAQQIKAAQAQAAKKAKQALAQQQKDARIVTNKAEKRMRNFIKSSSDANIKGWYKDQLILLWEVYYRLYAKGYNIADAEKWVEHNFKDTTTEDRNGNATKAQAKFRSEGNYLE